MKLSWKSLIGDSTVMIMLIKNSYGNDEFTQFMNEALVNGPSGFAPSFDIGEAVEWEIGIWEITAVGMNVAETAN